MLTFRYTGADGTMTEHEMLTSGMVEKQVKLEFSSEWENMRKTAVFKSGTIMKDRVDVTNLTTIPPEVLVNVGAYLYVGIYGVSKDGTRITPTVYARGPKICEGTDPSGDESTDPALPVWAQLQEQIDDLKQKGIGSDGADGLSTYYAPFAPDASWTAVFGKKISDVETAGRTLQVGDLLITSNAVLMRVTDVTSTQYSASKVAVLMEQTESSGNPVNGEDCGYYTVSITQPDANTAAFDFTPSKAGMAAVQQQTVQLPAGADGYTPVRGTDYWTDADKAEIKKYVDDAILGGAW